MNEQHRVVCASDEWGDAVRNFILPWSLEGIDGDALGGHLLEIGPGPGRTTEILHTMVPAMTAVELDPDLASALGERLSGSNVTVVEHDATSLPFGDGEFSAGVCFSMLHHVPTVELQDKLLAEMVRAVAPGGWVVGSDSLASDDLAEFHVDDTYNPIDPAGLPARLEAVGLRDVDVATNDFAFRFRGRAT